MIERIHGDGVAVLLVEQNVALALGLASPRLRARGGRDRRVRHAGALRQQPHIRRAYLGLDRYHRMIESDYLRIIDAGLAARARPAQARHRRRGRHGGACRRVRTLARRTRSDRPRSEAARRRAHLHDARAVHATASTAKRARCASRARTSSRSRTWRSSGCEARLHDEQSRRLVPPVRPQAPLARDRCGSAPRRRAPRRARARRHVRARCGAGARRRCRGACEAAKARGRRSSRKYDGYSTREFLEEQQLVGAAIELFGLVHEPGIADELVLPRAPARGGRATSTSTGAHRRRHGSAAARRSCPARAAASVSARA